ncbi:MAG TPA: multicopper oxidase domain-containing protein, partial [Thermoplasmata archaeon]|nr:multicopper oxidase domain-containing protein [Thermoplasmata archaeon]
MATESFRGERTFDRTPSGGIGRVARRALTGEVQATPSYILIYLAVGVLLAEAAVGGFLVVGGGSLLKTGGTVSQEPPVPNGPAVAFVLTAHLTGYVGASPGIAGKVDPTLVVGWGDHVTITVVNGEPMTHNFHLDYYNLQSPDLTGIGRSANVTFQASEQGSFDYYCTIPGHRQAGMQGVLEVGAIPNPIGPEANLTSSFISHSPTSIPSPITREYSTTVNVYLRTVEVTAELEPGVSYTYWTYNGTVPGPFLRVRVNDTVIVHLYNDPTSSMSHSVDFHAVTGPGGGASVTQTAPGHWSNFSFLAMVPGLFVYHCGTPNIPTHI